MAVVDSWGRVVREEHNVQILSNPVQTLKHEAHSFPGLAYGKGRSYGDVCLNPNGLLWKTEFLDNFIKFDTKIGVLTCQAGVSFQTINQTTINKGWMLPVTPGTKFLTLGGAVANDVHGKNHHKMGSIGHHIISLKLLRTDGTLIVCGPNENVEWFYATLGGLGLTGLIIEVSLQLRPVSSDWLDTESIAFNSLEDFYELSDESEEAWEYTVAWVDCTNKKNVRGVFMRANHSERSYDMPSSKKLSVPFAPPISLVNKLTLKPFNFLYYHLNALKQGEKKSHYDAYFYPLDNIHNWNLIYGKKGFYQYQVAIPQENRVDAIDEMLKEISKSNLGSFLAVLKTFGNKESLGMMSFPMHGSTLALDFSNLGNETLALFSKLDSIVESAHGRIYPAKDGRMPKSLFRSSYPKLSEFLAYKDPGISSAFSRRVMEN